MNPSQQVWYSLTEDPDHEARYSQPYQVGAHWVAFDVRVFNDIINGVKKDGKRERGTWRTATAT